MEEKLEGKTMGRASDTPRSQHIAADFRPPALPSDAAALRHKRNCLGPTRIIAPAWVFETSDQQLQYDGFQVSMNKIDDSVLWACTYLKERNESRISQLLSQTATIVVEFSIIPISPTMSSAGTVSPRYTPCLHRSPQAQEMSSILNNPFSQELIHSICRNNFHLRQRLVDLEEELQLWKQPRAEKTQQNTQIVSNHQQAQKETADISATTKNLHFQPRQQSTMMTSTKEQNTEAFSSSDWEVHKCEVMKEQLETERRCNGQLMQFFEALNIMKQEEFEKLRGHGVDLNNILASLAAQVEFKKQDDAAKNEVLRQYRGMHEQLVAMVQKLIKYADDWEEVDSVGLISQTRPC